MIKGTQIIWTPWRFRNELIVVKAWLYATNSDYSEEVQDERKKACDLISAWKSRGGLSHAVESTWLLTEACLADEIPQIPIFSIKAGYVTAISRFVTGLIDAEQVSKHKVSMYTKAQQIGLPALFVDIRHEGAHGEMPLLHNLRDAARRALLWLWDHYWNGLAGELKDFTKEVQCTGEQKLQRASQPGEWAQWKGPWSEKPIGALP